MSYAKEFLSEHGFIPLRQSHQTYDDFKSEWTERLERDLPEDKKALAGMYVAVAARAIPRFSLDVQAQIAQHSLEFIQQITESERRGAAECQGMRYTG